MLQPSYLAFVGSFNTWFFLAVTLLGIEVVIIVVNHGTARLLR